ncbi:SDR family oxidoreductase [Schaalia sp. JY-X159]|uniref:SDR family oxidoreductase n=1 Tax=Schaalia sp. JY-X159 TaxID=2758575 RepID=UPI00165D8EB8|nr:SDR family oxidoreductase [Schaalia sp. JY-X159]
MTSRRALVSGASSGIGRATVRVLVADGWDVVATARRTDRLETLAEETGCEVFTADLTRDEDVAALAEFAGSAGLDAVVNVAGGALGVDRIDEADTERWKRMFDINVMATLNLTQACLPLVRRNGGGSLVFVTSTAAHGTYPGGGGYAAAKHAERQIATTLRLELAGEPIRVTEIAPGMVKTEEFSLVRLGDARAAEDVYAGVEGPLVASDVAEAIRWSLDAPLHVNVDLMVLRPVAQSTNTDVVRRQLAVKDAVGL